MAVAVGRNITTGQYHSVRGSARRSPKGVSRYINPLSIQTKSIRSAIASVAAKYAFARTAHTVTGRAVSCDIVLAGPDNHTGLASITIEITLAIPANMTRRLICRDKLTIAHANSATAIRMQ